MSTATHCPYCALQCATSLTAGPSGATTVTGRDFPTNNGRLCRKGWTAPELLTAPDRLTSPLLRGEDGELHPASWDEALDRVVNGVRAAQHAYGPDAVGIFGSGGLTNEKAYTLGKLARVALRTSRIDYNGRFCMSSAAAAANRAFGLDRGLPFPLTDLDRAGTVLLLGSNVADTMPPLVQHLSAARAAGGLLVVDPRRSATATLTADGAGQHLQPTPGSDLALLLGLCHVIVHDGLADETYVRDRTSGYPSIVRSVSGWWPQRVQQVTGVPAALVRSTAHQLADAARRGRSGDNGCYVLTGRGVEQHVDGTDTATAAINLALLLGLPGTPGNGYGTVTGQGNGQGGREHGQKSDQLPGYRSITDPAARKHVAAVWGVHPETIPGPGLPAVEMLTTLGLPDGVRCLLVHGSNPAVSAPDAGAVRAALRRLDLLVVADFFLSETAAQADVVLPVAQWAEEEGTMTNLEGRVLRRRRALRPPPGVRDELAVLADLAGRLGSPVPFSDDPAEVFAELARASAGGRADYSGLSYRVLDDEDQPAFWPYRAGSTGTPRLFLDRFAHEDGRARLVPVAVGQPAEALARDGTVALVSGRLLEHYQSGAQTRRVRELADARPGPELELNPVTARRLGIPDGSEAEVSNDRGTVRVHVRTTRQVRQDTAFLPFHFPGSANELTSVATDPVSGMPEFKAAAVHVRAVPEETRTA
ncbi:molybdopterin oxidoreductase family protein [Georgenia sp. 10Sc9-8]|uniref:Molybdopterin oxidoreductase family protein n=1 Tax=Georgenia halotolerans TaxID=3028317 RepID=A0ABT5TY60_9MICO|nr:molybdopterin oxidoreductase family protein [Georgenia halotolerans]